MKGRQKVFMVYRSYRIDESRGFIYSYADLQAVKLRGGEPDLERFHKHWLSVCSKLSKPVEEHIRQTLYYDNVKALPVLKETIYHYDLADDGSDKKTLKVLMDAVEKIIDKKVREANRAAVEKAASGLPVPSVAATQAKKQPRKRGGKKKTAVSDSESDNGRSTGNDRLDTASIASSTGTVVSAPAVNDECRDKSLCYKFQRNTCPHMKDASKCKWKHEKCKTPLPEGWCKKGKGQGQGQGTRCFSKRQSGSRRWRRAQAA